MNPLTEQLKLDIVGDQRTFQVIFDERFELVDKSNKVLWLKTTDVYPVFQELGESEFNIKYKMSQLGIKCARVRNGSLGQCTFFQGLHWRDS